MLVDGRRDLPRIVRLVSVNRDIHVAMEMVMVSPSVAMFPRLAISIRRPRLGSRQTSDTRFSGALEGISQEIAGRARCR